MPLLLGRCAVWSLARGWRAWESELAREETSKAHERASQRPLKHREGGQGNGREEGRGEGVDGERFFSKSHKKRGDKERERDSE